MHVRDVSGSNSGFASVAITGTLWASGQMILNRGATVVATLVISRYLSVEEVAMATLAVMIVRFLSVLPPLTMSDVLISRGQHADRFMSSAQSTALLVAVLTLVVVSVLAPAIISVYPQFPRVLLYALVVVVALRAIGDGAQVGPLTELRISFRNRELAVIDGSLQLVATALGVVLAVLGAGAWAIIVPISFASVGKAIGYRLMRRRLLGPLRNREFIGSRGAASRSILSQEFGITAGAHYVHGVIDTLPVLLLGKLAGEAAAGFYAFGFNLAVQAEAIIAAQISSMLQPVLSRFRDDANRQIASYLRTLRFLGACSVPVCACQAAFADAAFKLCFEPRWEPAAPIFAILSLCGAFFFATAPTMALLKAQGRSRTLLAWQSGHLFVSAILLTLAALYGGAIWVATASTGIWACSLVLAAWLGIRSQGDSPWTVIKVFVAPWITAFPIGLAAWYLSGWLLTFGVWGSLVDLGILAPATFVAMMGATRWSQPSTFREMLTLAEVALARLKRR